MDLSKSYLINIRKELMKLFGQKWASKITEKSDCSYSYVNKVFNKQVLDQKSVIENSLALIEEENNKKLAVVSRYNKIVRTKIF